MSSLIGADVVDVKGAALGSISELMLDGDSGAVAYAVLAYGGVFGVGEKLFAVPWCAFAVDDADGTITVAVARGQLDQWPGFDKDAWPTEADAAFR